ncbi:MAG: DUF4190 domain-containing protein [Actinobacteria bacterium]|nr:DUF4190 domain-containing protein [Actinomycetota bacterium]
MQQPVTYTHTGHRYVLGYGADFYGIWDRAAPSEPVERFPRDDGGWQSAWQRFGQLEPSGTPVGGPGSVPSQPAYPYAQAPGPPHYAQPQRTNGFAVASLVFGIIGGVLFALIFGYVAKGQIDRSGGAQGGRGMAVAGIALGWAWLALILLYAVFIVPASA